MTQSRPKSAKGSVENINQQKISFPLTPNLIGFVTGCLGYPTPNPGLHKILTSLN